ncbi:MAG: 50S ribosomal protein L7 [Clostridiales bacterium]|nr:50S ribosomal protein L7 [Clostridiales bacterium]MDD7387504.1 50S ribosomal protein L7 [Bacillota bacterium]MDY6041651.1 50S ribosomal protein L7 [Candidatus Faecousia sp.]
MDKALNYLAIARKAGLAELGEEPVGAVTRAGKGYLVLVASDASDHTWRRAKSFVAGTEQQCVRLPYSKDEMGMAVGRSSLAIAAVTDAALALALVKSLPDGDAAAEEALSRRTEKLNQRKKEARAHQRNLRKGKK